MSRIPFDNLRSMPLPGQEQAEPQPLQDEPPPENPDPSSSSDEARNQLIIESLARGCTQKEVGELLGITDRQVRRIIDVHRLKPAIEEARICRYQRLEAGLFDFGEESVARARALVETCEDPKIQLRAVGQGIAVAARLVTSPHRSMPTDQHLETEIWNTTFMRFMEITRSVMPAAMFDDLQGRLGEDKHLSILREQWDALVDEREAV